MTAISSRRHNIRISIKAVSHYFKLILERFNKEKKYRSAYSRSRRAVELHLKMHYGDVGLATDSIYLSMSDAIEASPLLTSGVDLRHTINLQPRRFLGINFFFI